MVFHDEWTDFIRNVRILIDLKPEWDYGFNSDDLYRIYNPVSTALTSEQALSEFQLAIDSAESGIPEIQELETTPPAIIEMELSVFNESMPESADQINNFDPGEQQGFVNVKSIQGKTIKDSVESVLPLPRWLTRFLDLLNEILNTIRI